MSNSNTTVVIAGDSSLDIAAVGNWLEAHIWLFLLVAFIAFLFFIFQKGGFAEKLLDYRIRSRELEAKKLDDVRVIADIFRRKYDRPDPLLPFENGSDGKVK